ncbi:MAG TPA: hypothetical protein DCY93_00280 [Firmicutes bacterium]|nr:hypothetical protein [Bacillota bacterium]
MISFLKTCLKGFLTIILSPLWVSIFALSLVAGVILFVYSGIKCLIGLVTHRSHGIYDTVYDKRAKEILSNPNFNYAQPQPPVQPQPQPYANYPAPNYNGYPPQGYPTQPPYPQQPPYPPQQPGYPPQYQNPFPGQQSYGKKEDE